MNRQFASFLISSIFFLYFVTPAKSESKSEGVLDRIERQGILKVAIREDAPPFGYLTASGNLQGYCLDFFALLEKQLIKNLKRNTLSIKLFKSNPSSRFTLVQNNLVDLECGPNTIRSDVPEETSFSSSFFITGTQFLVKQKNQDRLNLKQDLEGITLGVIENTTTAKFLAEQYPLATLRKFSGVTARSRGVQAVEQNQIEAMVSDGILLRAAAQQQELSSAKYPLIPEIPLTCDRYGMIIQGNDPQWQDFVNSVINSPEAEELASAWFGQLFSYIQTAQDFCQ